jgi:hypothetical protein
MEKCLPKQNQRPGQGKGSAAMCRKVCGAAADPGEVTVVAVADAGPNQRLAAPWKPRRVNRHTQ